MTMTRVRPRNHVLDGGVSAPHGEYDKLISAAATLRAVATSTLATDLIVVCT